MPHNKGRNGQAEQSMDWDKLRVFHAVAEAGSFTHAGETLGLSQSAVSRQIGALEKSVNTALFHRHARGLLLTEQGELLYQTAHEVFAKLAMTEAILAESYEKPRGELKVTTTVGFGSTWLTPRIREFLDLYPDMSISLVLTDDELDLSMREADVGIRFRRPTQPDLIQRRLLTVHSHIYASPEYIERNGVPQTVEELDEHGVIIYGENPPAPISNINWILDIGSRRGLSRKIVFKVNNIYALRQAILSGLGIGALPDYIVQGNPQLMRVLPDVQGPRFDTYFAYPEELRNSKRINVFRDFLIRKVSSADF